MKITFHSHAQKQAAERGINLRDAREAITRVGHASRAPQGRTLYEVRAEEIEKFDLCSVAFNGLRVITAPQRYPWDGVLVVTVMREWRAY